MEVLAFGALVSAITTFFVVKRWKKIITQIRGKKIAVLGASTSGKTTLFRYLEMLPMESAEIQATRTIQNTGIGEIKISIGDNYISFRFKETKDLPGDVDNRNLYWENLVKESYRVLYLVNTYELLKGEKQKETKDRIKEDLNFIDKWAEHNPKKVIIIGNHFDKIDEQFMYDKYSEHHKKFKDNQVFKESGRGMEKIIASFKRKEGVTKALEDVFKIIRATNS